LNEKFLRDYNDVRNFTLEDAIESKNKWFEFLLFWSKHCNYGIDNILNLYSYNKDGLLFATFDQWNNIERRIKSGSKGIPILVNNKKLLYLIFLTLMEKMFFCGKIIINLMTKY